jgi:hypothetical protein
VALRSHQLKTLTPNLPIYRFALANERETINRDVRFRRSLQIAETETEDTPFAALKAHDHVQLIAGAAFTVCEAQRI